MIATPSLIRKVGQWLEGSQGISYDEPKILRLMLTHERNALDGDSLRYVLNELPELEVVILDGTLDPLLHPCILECLAVLKEQRRLRVQLRSFGLGLAKADIAEGLWEVAPDRLSFVLPGYRPSHYALYSQRNASELPEIRQHLQRWITQRRHRETSSSQNCFTDISFWVERLNVSQMEAMIYWAEEIGVDAVCFEPVPSQGTSWRSQAILEGDALFQEARQALRPQQFRIPVALPVPVKKGATGCKAPFQMVQLMLGDQSVSPCLYPDASLKSDMGKLLGGDYWNSRAYQQYRKAHQYRGALPEACQYCPQNQGAALGEVLNSQWLPKALQHGNYGVFAV
jgi:hypothetical protein